MKHLLSLLFVTCGLFPSVVLGWSSSNTQQILTTERALLQNLTPRSTHVVLPIAQLIALEDSADMALNSLKVWQPDNAAHHWLRLQMLQNLCTNLAEGMISTEQALDSLRLWYSSPESWKAIVEHIGTGR